MSRYVVDASVAVKWFVPETHTEAALRLLDGSHQLLAPDLLLPEMGNILWKKVRRRQLTTQESHDIIRDFMTVPLSFHPPLDLAAPALELAIETDRTVYDAVYLTLAVLHGCRLVTADRRFHDAIRRVPLRPHLCWVEDEL